ncbi:CVNH domain-containing protein [Truncatella angustata]|uniref:CVNH domain-containing protein n=1 Tax=Truncatella angustata TaxID=152316 RepID=A0A9P8UY33_9PEZI|nr:CVNH domain-containing protein [Truncatella angustata]KAH6660462.1 CVNH domain-containing protein [Truncatella angustata]
MADYTQGPRPNSSYGESSQHPNAPEWHGYPPTQNSSQVPHHSPYASPPPSGQSYGQPHGSPQSPPSVHGSGYYPPQPQYSGNPPAGQYTPSGYGYNGHQGQQSYYQAQQHSPHQLPSQPQYAQSPPPQYEHSPQRQYASPGYLPQIKQEYTSPPVPGQVPQTEEERGLMGALAGGAAGGFAGHKVNHGFLGAVGGAFAGHKLQDAYKDHKKNSRPSSRRSSCSSSSSSDDDKHGHKPQKQHAPPPPVVHGTMGNFTQSSARISLDNDHDLIAECGACDGSRKLSSISLNRLLTNDDGHFRWARDGNFAASARNVRLIHGGRFLQAELCQCNGSWRWAEICLDERIENSNGNLQMLW